MLRLLFTELLLGSRALFLLFGSAILLCGDPFRFLTRKPLTAFLPLRFGSSLLFSSLLHAGGASLVVLLVHAFPALFAEVFTVAV